MIEKNRIIELCDEWLKDKEYFLVFTDVTDDKITVEIDHKDGVWIDDCVALSRFISENCAPDIDDYELEVGSAGIGQPFRILQQYINNIGNEVDVLPFGGKKKRGILLTAEADKFSVEVPEKQKIDGKKRPQTVNVTYTYCYDEVKWVKAVLEFK